MYWNWRAYILPSQASTCRLVDIMSGRPYRVGASSYIHAAPACCALFRLNDVSLHPPMVLGLERRASLQVVYYKRKCLHRSYKMGVSDALYHPWIQMLGSADDWQPHHAANDVQAWAQCIAVAGLQQMAVYCSSLVTCISTIMSMSNTVFRPRIPAAESADNCWPHSQLHTAHGA